MEEKEYRAHPAFSASDIKVYLSEGFKLFLYNKMSGEAEPLASAALEFGTLTHLAALEPHIYDERVLTFNGKTPSSPNQQMFVDALIKDNVSVKEAYRRSYATMQMKDSDIEIKANALKEQLREYIKVNYRAHKMEKEAIIITEDKDAIFRKIGERVRRRIEEITGDSYMNCLYERPHFGELKEAPIKGKIDAIWVKGDEAILIDLKTTNNDEPYSFASSCRRYKYLEQLYIYGELIRQNIEVNRISYYIITALNRPPYNVEYFKINERLVYQDGRWAILSALDDIIDNMKKLDIWEKYLLAKEREDLIKLYKDNEEKILEMKIYESELDLDLGINRIKDVDEIPSIF